MGIRKPKPSPIPTEVDLRDAALCFEQWAKILREGNGKALELGCISLTWSRKRPDVVSVSVHAVPGGNIAPTMSLRNEIEGEQIALLNDNDGEAIG